MPKHALLRMGLLCVLGGLFSCEAFWGEAKGLCPSLEETSVGRSSRWKELAGQGGIPGCLRVAWGSAEARGVLAVLKPSGELVASRDGASVTFVLPAESRGQVRRFEFFAFGAQIPASQQGRHCTQTMGLSPYRCNPEPSGACWFSVRFQPGAVQGLEAQEVPQGCQWNLPPNSSNEPGPDGKVPFELRPEPADASGASDASDASDVSDRMPREPRPERREPASESREPEPDAQPEPGLPEFKKAPPWAAFGGSAASDLAFSVAVDAAGSVYLAGFVGDSGQIGARSFQATRRQGFVARFDPAGACLWVTVLGASLTSEFYGVAVDGKGEVYVTGQYSGNVQIGTVRLTSRGGIDIFVGKLDAKGQWLWAASAGGVVGSERGYQIEVGPGGKAYVAGAVGDRSFFGSSTPSVAGSTDAFVAEIDGATGRWGWVRAWGGSGGDFGLDLDVHPNGEIAVSGLFESKMTLKNKTLTANGQSDIFVGKLDSKGDWLWIQSAGSAGRDEGLAVAFDGAGDLFVAGKVQGVATFGMGTTASRGGADGFVARLSSKGTWLWARVFGSTFSDQVNGIALHPTGGVWITGSFHDSATFGSSTLSSNGNYDVFVARLSATGAWLQVASAGSTAIDRSFAMAVNVLGDPYVAGFATGNLSLGGTPYSPKGVGGDIFLWKVR